MGETLSRVPVEEVVFEAEQIVHQAAEDFVLPENERVLTEVDNLAMGRNTDGSYPDNVLESTRQNIFTMVQEGAMRYAITQTYHEVAEVAEGDRRKRTFTWLGKTALQVAESGYQFHHHESARTRVDIEVEEAVHNDEAIRPGYARLFISPRMTAQDAPHEVAKREHLHADDALRMSVAAVNEKSEIVGRNLSSLLVRDIPLAAWQRYLADPTNVFGRAFSLPDTNSAVPIMKLHKELEVPLENLPEGLLTVLKGVAAHIVDPAVHRKVTKHIAAFSSYDQAILERQGKHIAERWLVFKKALVDSRFEGFATAPVQEFITSLNDQWDDEASLLIQQHTRIDGAISMSRQLEVLIAEAYANLAFKRAKVISGDESVLEKTDAADIALIRQRERQIQVWQDQGYDTYAISRQEFALNQLVAGQDISVGGGCAGESTERFVRTGPRNKMSATEAEASATNQQEAAETAQEILEETKAERGEVPPKVRCTNCSKESKKELVVKPDKWQCPCCKYAVDICTGKPLNFGLENFGQRASLIAALVELTAPVEAKIAAVQIQPIELTEEAEEYEQAA